MKRILLILATFTAIRLLNAQEELPRREALKYAFFLSADLKVLQGTPIATDVDLKHPVALRDGDYGALVLPEAKLSADAIAKAGEQVVPIGQLWLHRLAPMRQGAAIPANDLRIVNLEAEGQSGSAVQLTLGVKGNGSGGQELLVFGKDKSPLLKVELKPIQAQQQRVSIVSAPPATGRMISCPAGRPPAPPWMALSNQTC